MIAGILDVMRADYPPSVRLVWHCIENRVNGARLRRMTFQDVADELGLSEIGPPSRRLSRTGRSRGGDPSGLGACPRRALLLESGLARAAHGQICFGFRPSPNVLGSAEMNSRTDGLNCAHSPYSSQPIGPLIPSNLIENTASRSAFLPI